jgi:hypothetical protein
MPTLWRETHLLVSDTQALCRPVSSLEVGPRLVHAELEAQLGRRPLEELQLLGAEDADPAVGDAPQDVVDLRVALLAVATLFWG